MAVSIEIVSLFAFNVHATSVGRTRMGDGVLYLKIPECFPYGQLLICYRYLYNVSIAARSRSAGSGTSNALVNLDHGSRCSFTVIRAVRENLIEEFFLSTTRTRSSFCRVT